MLGRKTISVMLAMIVSLLMAGTVLGGSVAINITDENDDVEERLDRANELDMGSSDLELPYEDEGMGDPQVIGIRFTGVGIPKGSFIYSASVQFQVDETKGGTDPVNVVIEGELAADAAVFENIAFNVTGRARTTAQAFWSVPNWTNVGDRGPDQATSDLSAVIQEIVDQDGWISGNSLVLIISDDPVNPSTGIRCAESEGETAMLLVEFGDVPVKDEIWREAEYPDVMGSNWRILSDPAASGLKALGSDNGDGDDNGSAPGAEWVAAYNFTAVGGDYKILFRGLEADSDSFWVRITTATSQTLEHPGQAGTGWVRFNGMDAPNGYAWDEVHSNDHSDEVVIWTLPAGENTLEIAKREDGTYLDGFVITNILDRDQNTMPSSIDPPPVAGGPVPEDGAIELDPTTLTVLGWTPPAVAVSSKVYLSADGTIDANDLVGETDQATLDVVLYPGVTYSWRVDSIEADGTENTGEVWTFDTMSQAAHFPIPADGGLYRIGVGTVLSWTSGLGALAHNVYFSDDKALVDARDPSVGSMFWLMNTFAPGDLAPGITYYWAVDEFVPPLTVAGPTWSLSAHSFGSVAITDPSLLLYYTFDEIQGVLINDLSGRENYGMVAGDADSIIIVNDVDMGNVLSLPGGDNQYVAAGPTGISGNDLTTIACWAKANSTSIPDWTLIFGFTGKEVEDGSGGNGSHFNIGSLGGPGGVGAHCWGWEETMVSDANALEWHHYAMTYDGTTIAYFLDGVAMDSDEAKSNVQDLSIRGDRVQVGSRATQASSFPGDVDDCRVYNKVLTEQEIVWAMNNMADVTGPDDMVQGVPNDGDWPGAEYPALAVDNNVNTKFLHRKGGATATGIQVAPAAGVSVVTGLTLTTANDTPTRDPITFEVYGSNESIDGPYELIAAGDVNDFNMTADWPRFTKNATTIAFENTVVYAYYQVLFPTLRGATQTLMQIAEVELIGTTVPLISSVVRSNGTSGDRARIGAFDGSSSPMAMVESGLADGAPVFSDRTYTWAGVPAEYVGTEYIATFNTDKNSGTTDVTYEVTISAPALVWITVDDRLASAQDSADSVVAAFAGPGTFVDSGIDLFILEDSNRSMSVFVAELPAGTYVFGSMDSGNNFYSIGAIMP